MGNRGVHVDLRVPVSALVDLEDGAGFGRVVDGVADLRDLQRPQTIAYIGAVKVARAGRRPFEILAGPDSIQVRRDGAPKDHLAQPGADNIVLDGDVEGAVLGVATDVLLEGLEELWQAVIEGQPAAKLAQQCVVEPREPPGLHIGQDVEHVQLLGDKLIAASTVVLWQLIRLVPERRLIDAVVLKQRTLHVVRNQGLIEVPDDGDLVLRKNTTSTAAFSSLTVTHLHSTLLVTLARTDRSRARENRQATHHVVFMAPRNDPNDAYPRQNVRTLWFPNDRLWGVS